MSNNVAEFFSKKGIKKFKSGAKAAFERHGVKTLAATAVLAGAFAACSDVGVSDCAEMEKPKTTYAIKENGDTLCAYRAIPVSEKAYARLQKLVNNATRSETGRAVLTALAKQGTTLCLEWTGFGSYGYFNPSENAISLNKWASDGQLQGTLIHEGRHVMQYARGAKVEETRDVASNIMTTRLREADDYAVETRFAFEMDNAGDAEPLNALKSNDEKIATAYARAESKHGAGSPRALKAAMLSWFDDKDYVEQYDDKVVSAWEDVMKKDSLPALKKYSAKKFNADSLLQTVCLWDGCAYAGTDGALLKTPRTAYLDAAVFNRVKKAGDVLRGKTAGAVSDNSAENFFESKYGRVERRTYRQKSAQSKAFAVKAVAKGR